MNSQASSGAEDSANTPSSRLLTAFAPAGPGPITAGSRLASLLAHCFDRSGIDVRPGDVVAVSNSAVMSAAGQFADCDSPQDFADCTAHRSAEVLAVRTVSSARGPHPTTRTLDRVNGHLRINAGLEEPASYPARVPLPPGDPRGVAHALRSTLSAHLRAQVCLVLVESAGASEPHCLASSCAQRPGAECTNDHQVASSAALVLDAHHPVAIVRGDSHRPATTKATSTATVNAAEVLRWLTPGPLEFARGILGAPPVPTPPTPQDASDDVPTRVNRAIRCARDCAQPLMGEDAWVIDVHNAGSRIEITPAPTPATRSAGGHPLVESSIGLGALLDRLQAALRIEALIGETTLTWTPRGAPSRAEVVIGLADQTAVRLGEPLPRPADRRAE